MGVCGRAGCCAAISNSDLCRIKSISNQNTSKFALQKSVFTEKSWFLPFFVFVILEHLTTPSSK